MRKILLFSVITLLALSKAFSQPLNVTFRSNLAYPGKTLANIWGYVDTLGNEYALVGTSAGVSIVNVTNPLAPVEVFAVAGINSQWREIKTWGKYAYVTTEGCCNGIQIINLSNLPASVNSKYYTGDGAINGQLTKAHALHVSNGYCYLYGTNLFSGAAVILNLADPWNPTYAGNTNNPGLSSQYIHDGIVSNDTLWGGHIYAGQFSVFNVANKAVPVLLQTQNTPNNFTHNTWLSDNHRVLFTTDEVSNSYLAAYDVSNINNITLLDKIQSTPGNGAIIHNVYVKNDFAIASYYTEGVIIVDAARPSNLIKTGQYDCSASYSGNGFHGAWGVYPYLPSGNLVVSDMETGLYVLTPNYLRGCYLEGTVTDTLSGALIPGASVQVAASSMNEVTNAAGQFKTGTVNAGTYTVTVSKTGYTTKVITGVVLSNGVLTNLNVQLALPGVNVSGKVEDVNATGIPLAKVVLEDNNGFIYNTTTDSAGNYVLNGVYPSFYTATAGKWKYNNSCQSILVNSPVSGLNFSLARGLSDDFTFDFGWTKTSTAKRGKWVRDLPEGTTFINLNDANPGEDVNSDCNNKAYITGNGGGAYNNDDVDSGYTNLVSPVLDLKTGWTDPVIKVNTWFFAEPGSNDTLIIRLQKGTTKFVLDNITVSSSNNSQWVQRSYRVKDYTTPTKNMKISFYVRDKNPDHAIEAGVDEFYVEESIPAKGDIPGEISFTDNSLIQSIYPNPFRNYIYGTLLNDEPVNLTITLYDITGRVVKTENVNATGEFQINVNENLDSGVYFMQLSSETETTQVKVIRQ